MYIDILTCVSLISESILSCRYITQVRDQYHQSPISRDILSPRHRLKIQYRIPPSLLPTMVHCKPGAFLSPYTPSSSSTSPNPPNPALIKPSSSPAPAPVRVRIARRAIARSAEEGSRCLVAAVVEEGAEGVEGTHGEYSFDGVVAK